MEHGGDIYTNRGIELDFSVNLNPLGPPEQVRSALRNMLDLIACYPDPLCRELRHALALKLGVPEAWILCGNGASEMLQAAVQAIKPTKVLIPVPTYQGYERAARAAGAEVVFRQLERENGFRITDDILEDIEALPEGSILFVCNPNNPVGNCIREDLLQRIAEKCGKAGIYLIVDECYLELVPGEEMRSMRRFLSTNPYLMIVRAFTKTYAMPGVRLGYLMASDEALRGKISLQQPEWSVSMLAQCAGLAALSMDRAAGVNERRGTDRGADGAAEGESEKGAAGRASYLSDALKVIHDERAYVSQGLRDLGADVYDGEAGFVLFSCDRDLYEPFRESGVLIRRCDNLRGLESAGSGQDNSRSGQECAESGQDNAGSGQHFYRIGLRKHSENVRLLDRIQDLLSQ